MKTRKSGGPGSVTVTRTTGVTQVLAALAADLTGLDLAELFTACLALNVRLREAAFVLGGEDGDPVSTFVMLPLDGGRLVGVLSGRVELVLGEAALTPEEVRRLSEAVAGFRSRLEAERTVPRLLLRFQRGTIPRFPASYQVTSDGEWCDVQLGPAAGGQTEGAEILPVLEGPVSVH
ncbi:MAG: hypothetical protein HY814_06580 [Candidatus Riflebacteria bacterium]|nr:hypothetical protein [Candidatus Riflebacteria bacterium]